MYDLPVLPDQVSGDLGSVHKQTSSLQKNKQKPSISFITAQTSGLKLLIFANTALIHLHYQSHRSSCFTNDKLCPRFLNFPTGRHLFFTPPSLFGPLIQAKNKWQHKMGDLFASDTVAAGRKRRFRTALSPKFTLCFISNKRPRYCVYQASLNKLFLIYFSWDSHICLSGNP